MPEIFQYHFMQNALLAGLLAGVACSVLSVFVVSKRMSFIGSGIAHAAFGGVALGLLLDVNVDVTAALFAVVVALLVGLLGRDKNVSEDSAVGLLLTVSMALGLVFLSLKEEYTSEVFGYLFGDILAVTDTELKIILVLSFVVVLTVRLFYKELLYFTFDEEMAGISGLPIGILRTLLFVLIAMTVVLAMKAVGIILVSALLVIPGMTALIISRRFSRAIVLAAVFGVGSCFAGLLGSALLGISSGATIVLTLAAIFALAWTIKRLTK